MHSIEIFQIDAFTDKVFHGNPAAVCLLKHWLNDELLQAIAVENNLSETAFIIEAKEGYQIRWFTPNGEINLCGHATLAAGFLLFELGKSNNNTIHFSSLSGSLVVVKRNTRFVMDFPRLNYEAIPSPETFTHLVDKSIRGIFTSDLDYLILLSNENDVLNAQVDLKSLEKMPKRGLILTAESNDADFYSRCFYPKHHIPEDPVTGSAHCVLAPFWSERLNKTSLRGLQGSFRKGEVLCDVFAERIHISGHCKWYFKGHLVI
ncbi:PhzF family phenazine biosynthesis protein [Legionella nagasakiensis]|uniref:PhzF family phenazine biosynthesis protein n=1 Tax=Legionella nagasakiensis TaxID=535290 RepID=UPI00105672B1|nr:PhzF family phenazine biosynthesis protein [Legionella nagasakiensis]